MKNIILSIKDEITGQLIITTHNTLLLEILPKECIYILSADYEEMIDLHMHTLYSDGTDTVEEILKNKYSRRKSR